MENRNWVSIVKGLKKWSYLLLWAGMGIVYLTCVDKWQVYAEPLTQVKNWYNASEEDSEQVVVAAVSDAVNGSIAGRVKESEKNEAPDGELTSDGAGEAGPVPEGESDDGVDADFPLDGEAEGTADDVTGSGEPVYVTVEDDYFSDAVFIGDSRTVGLFEYAGLEDTAAFYASTGLTVYKMFDSEIVSVPGERKKITVEQALQQNTFAKIYLMIGINEMGTGTVESFLEKYHEVVDHLQELQPDAIIYLQAIIKVTSERSAQGDYINNEGIEARNEGIAMMADNERIFYLDVNPLICDETGGMEPTYTFDGVHLKAKYIEIWKDYLKTHAISS